MTFDECAARIETFLHGRRTGLAKARELHNDLCSQAAGRVNRLGLLGRERAWSWQTICDRLVAVRGSSVLANPMIAEERGSWLDRDSGNQPVTTERGFWWDDPETVVKRLRNDLLALKALARIERGELSIDAEPADSDGLLPGNRFRHRGHVVQLTAAQCRFIALFGDRTHVEIREAMNPGDNAVWDERYTHSKRAKINTFLSRLSSTLCAGDIHITFRLVRGTETIERDDPKSITGR